MTVLAVLLAVAVLVALVQFLWPSPLKKTNLCHMYSNGTFLDREEEFGSLTKGFRSYWKIGCQLRLYECGSSTQFISVTSHPGHGKSELACYYSRQCEGTLVLYKDMYGSSEMRDLLVSLLLPMYIDNSDAISKLRSYEFQDLQEMFELNVLQTPANVLLFIDNCDTMLNEKGREFIKWMKSFAIDGITNVRILITSRERGLDKDDILEIELPPLPIDAAVQLLQGRSKLNRSVALQICELTGNLPMALVLVRPLLNYYNNSAMQMVEGLRESRLGPLCHKDPYFNVCAAFDFSYNHLSEKCQSIGQLYSYFPGSFSAADSHEVLTLVGNVKLADVVECEEMLVSKSLMTLTSPEQQKYPIVVREYFYGKLITSTAIVKALVGKFCFVYSRKLASLSHSFDSDPAGSMTRLLADQHNFRHMLKLITQHHVSISPDTFTSLLHNMADLSRAGVGVLFSDKDLSNLYKEVITISTEKLRASDALDDLQSALLSNWKYFANPSQMLLDLETTGLSQNLLAKYYIQLEYEVYTDFIEKASNGPFSFEIDKDSNWTLWYNSATGARFYCYSTIWLPCYQSMLDFLYLVGETEILDYLQKNYATVTQKLAACSTSQCYIDLLYEYEDDKFTAYIVRQYYTYYTAELDIDELMHRFLHNFKYWSYFHHNAVLGEGTNEVLWEEFLNSLTPLRKQDVFDENNVQPTVELMKQILLENRKRDGADINNYDVVDNDDNDVIDDDDDVIDDDYDVIDDDDDVIDDDDVVDDDDDVIGNDNDVIDDDDYLIDDPDAHTVPDRNSDHEEVLQEDSRTVVKHFLDLLLTADYTQDADNSENDFHLNMSAYLMKIDLPEEEIGIGEEDRKLAQQHLRGTCFTYVDVILHTPPLDVSVVDSFWYRFNCYKQFCTVLGSDDMFTKQLEYTMYSMLRGRNRSSLISINQKILEYHRSTLTQEPFSYIQALLKAAELYYSSGKQRVSQLYCTEARDAILKHQVNPQWNRTLSALILIDSCYCRMKNLDNNLLTLIWDIFNAGHLLLLEQFSDNAVPQPTAEPHTIPMYQHQTIVINDDERAANVLQRHGIACSSEPLMFAVPQYDWVTALKDMLIYVTRKVYHLMIGVALAVVACIMLLSRR